MIDFFFFSGVQIYMMLVEVFEVEKSRARWYYPFAYGLPVIIVAASAITDPVSYGTKDACWLNTQNYFIFAFVGPVIAILLVSYKNFFIFLLLIEFFF